MNFRKWMVPVAAVALLFAGWRAYGGAGIAIVLTGTVTFMLLHFSRLLYVMKKASDRPKGYVGSAVMLNAKLKKGVNLLHVMAITHALGEPLSETNAQPEVFRWTDGTNSHVTCKFVNGRLESWVLVRPETLPEEPQDSPQEAPASAPAASTGS